MGLSLVSAAAEKPVTLSEAKAHLRVDGSDEDTLINALIDGATQVLDGRNGIINRALITQTWDLTLNDFPISDYDGIEIPLPPTQSIASISYIDSDGSLQVLDSNTYTLDNAQEPAKIYLSYNESWPTTRDEKNAVTVRFVAGYGDAGSVPQALKQSILLMVGHWYKNREISASHGGEVTEIPMGARWLYEPYLMKGF